MRLQRTDSTEPGQDQSLHHTRGASNRLRGHLRGRIRGSTFRLALASVLRDQLALVVEAPKLMSRASEQALTTWIAEHLSVAVHPVADPAPLADLESRVLSRIDPPLNLDKMPINPLRVRLTELRGGLIRGSVNL